MGNCLFKYKIAAKLLNRLLLNGYIECLKYSDILLDNKLLYRQGSMRFILIFSILFATELNAQEDFGFVYSWGLVHSYNSFNQTYTKSVCGDERPYKIKLELKKKNLLEFKNKLEELNFWFTSTSDFFNHENGEKPSMITPCEFQSLFVELGSNTNSVELKCFGSPKSVKLLKERYEKFFGEIEEKIMTHSAFIKAQESSSSCIIR